jgi:hypothetical protein
LLFLQVLTSVPFRDFEERSTPAAHGCEADQLIDVELDHTTLTSGGTVPNLVVDWDPTIAQTLDLLIPKIEDIDENYG